MFETGYSVHVLSCIILILFVVISKEMVLNYADAYASILFCKMRLHNGILGQPAARIIGNHQSNNYNYHLHCFETMSLHCCGIIRNQNCAG